VQPGTGAIDAVPVGVAQQELPAGHSAALLQSISEVVPTGQGAAATQEPLFAPLFTQQISPAVVHVPSDIVGVA
jgi:hypothetical protein